MAWVRLADDFADHPKIVAAGPLAGWLWLCGIAYCNRYLTDGFVPAAQVRRLADVDDPAALAVRLVDAGLWELTAGGYRVHDYDSYQPSAEVVKAERERNARRAAAFRERHTARTPVVTPVVPAIVTAFVRAPRTRSRSRSINPAGDPPCTPTPQPPSPQAGPGERPSRRRRGSVDVQDDVVAPAGPEVLAPPTDADRAPGTWPEPRSVATSCRRTPRNWPRSSCSAARQTAGSGCERRRAGAWWAGFGPGSRRRSATPATSTAVR